MYGMVIISTAAAEIGRRIAESERTSATTSVGGRARPTPRSYGQLPDLRSCLSLLLLAGKEIIQYPRVIFATVL